MPTDYERELRIKVNNARTQCHDYRIFELIMVMVASLFVGLPLLGITMDAPARHIFLWCSAAFLVASAFFSGYRSMLLQPEVDRTQAELNDYIDASV